MSTGKEKSARWKAAPSIAILIVAPFIMVAVVILSVLYGAKDMSFSIVLDAILHYDRENVDHAIIVTSRLPRVLAALLVGAFLAISGAVMQGMTRNYLASPSIMGVTDGSAFFITIAMILLPGASNLTMIMLSMAGSAFGALIVFGFGSLLRGGLSPVRLAIIGTVIGTFLSSLSALMATYFQISQDISFWYNAKLHQADMDMLLLALPLGLVGFILALLLSGSLTILSLGDETAVSLGQRTAVVKALAMISVIAMTGTAVALVGKIGFVGLIIPHITRFLVGVDYRWLIPCSGVIGAIFLACCDLASRFINYPFETPIGVVTAIIGVPFFLYLIRTKGGGKHA